MTEPITEKGDGPMPATIGDQLRWNKPQAIALVAPYVDTLEVSSRRPYPSPLLKAIVKNSGSMLPNEVRDRIDDKVIWHYLLAINQPSRYLIDLLQYYHERHATLSIYRFHLALDVIDIAPGWTREQIVEVFCKLFHMRYRRGSDHMLDEQGTLYSIETAGRKTRPYRNTTLYTNRDSKLTGECDAIHFEIKLERKRSVLRVIDEPADLLTLKPDQFFAKEIAIKDIRAILETIIQRSIRDTTPHPLIRTEPHIRELVRRAGFDHASTFAHAFPKQFERVRHWDCIDVEPVLNWAHADVGCDDEVGELHCLLPLRSNVND
jgi:AraC-like DNA-binding protein